MKVNRLKIICILLGLCCCFQAFSKPLTIVLVGNTGAGKTTLLTAIFNSMMYQNTPKNSQSSIKFVAPLNTNAFVSTPPASKPSFLAHTSRNNYGHIQAPHDADYNLGSSDTQDLIGYRFTPNSGYWFMPKNHCFPHLVEVIDTPGINDTNRTDFDNKSTHIQVIEALEKLVKDEHETIDAIFLVLDGDTTRDDKIKETLQAVGKIFPNSVSKKFFLVFNRVGKKDSVSDELTSILVEKLGQLSINSILDKNCIHVDLKYISKFNQYLNRKVDPAWYQSGREYTEKNLRNTISKLNLSYTGLCIGDYPQFLHYKHHIAENFFHIITLKLESDEYEKEKHELKTSIRRLNTAYDDIVSPYELDGLDVLGHIFFIGIPNTVYKQIKRNEAQERQRQSNIPYKIARLKGKLNNTLSELDTRNTKINRHTIDANNAFQSLQQTSYADTYDLDDNFVVFVAEIKDRISVHFPKVYSDQNQREKINGYIDECCEGFNL